MTIKQHGGVFGRNPTFNDVTVENDLVVDGTLTIGGNVITGLDYEGGWNASTNTPDLTTTPPAAGKFWIVSVAGSTNLGGITNWTQGDWALYDGSAWQRVEGGTVDLTNGVTGILPIANGGTNASDASTARTNLGSGAVGDNLFTATTALAAQQAMDTEVGVDVQAYDATILKSADIGVSVQGYDANTAKYDDTTANFTGTLQNGGSNVLVDTDIGSTVEAYDATILKSANIGSTVQGYDADTAKYDDATANFTGTLQNGGSNVLVDTDIGSTVEAYDSTILKSADIGSSVQAYDADTTKNDVSNTFTQPQIFPAGTASAPSITTTGDTNTGIFFPAADTIAFTEGGAEAMRLTSDGRLGIGTTAPATPLVVNGRLTLGSKCQLFSKEITVPDDTTTELLVVGANTTNNFTVVEVTVFFTAADQITGMAKYMIRMARNGTQVSTGMSTILSPSWGSKNSGAATYTSVTFSYDDISDNGRRALRAKFVSSGAAAPFSTNVILSVNTMSSTQLSTSSPVS